jgi:thiamine kinase
LKQSQLLENINIQLSENVQWHPLSHTGTTNQLYTGNCQEQAVVLRIDTEQRVLGVCRQREEKVLNFIRTKSWAPLVLQQQVSDETHQGWLLMKRYMALEDMLGDSLHAQILACVSDWQQITNLPPFDYSALWKAYQNKIDDMGYAPQAQVLLNSIRTLMVDLSDIAGVESCLVHHDLHFENLLSNEGQLVVIDWEYAGLGTPWLDGAALVLEFSMSHHAVAALPAFKHLDSETFERGINIAKTISQQLNQLWYEFR